MTQQQQKALDELKPTVHLTLTGIDAGMPLCKHEKNPFRYDYVHAMYCPQFIMDSEKVCKVCKSIWKS